MKILFDTNVILDVMLDRQPFSNIAAELFSKVESGKMLGFIGATTVTTIYYLAKKAVGDEQAMVEIEKLIKLFKIAPINRAVIKFAMELKFSDFEDAVLYAAAKKIGVDAIVTRDIKGFKQGTVTVYTPKKLMKKINEEEIEN